MWECYRNNIEISQQSSRRKQNRTLRSTRQSLVECHKCQPGSLGKGCKVTIRPLLWGGFSAIGSESEPRFDPLRLIKVMIATVLKKQIVDLPCRRLGHHILAHRTARSQQAKQANLGQATEIYSVLRPKRIDPLGSNFMVGMTGMSQGNPYIHIREKGCIRKRPPRQG